MLTPSSLSLSLSLASLYQQKRTVRSLGEKKGMINLKKIKT